MTDQPYWMKVGMRVVKPEGYPFDSVIVAIFAKLDGQWRVVCESTVIPGMLHVFSPSQLAPAPPLPRRKRWWMLRA